MWVQLVTVTMPSVIVELIAQAVEVSMSKLELVVVWKGDTKTVRFLGQAFLRTCEVERWKKVGYGVYRRWSPAAWLVPRFRLAALSPLSEEEVIALQRERPH